MERSGMLFNVLPLPRHPRFTSQLSYEIPARNDHQTFKRILAWSCLLHDSIIFQKRTQPGKTTNLQNAFQFFLDFPAEKSFNREAKPENQR